MLGFLRRIRRSLIEEGQLRKYLVYAIGEILLVVIGILIALSINNNNQYKKDRILEIEILQEISDNIKADVADHRQNMAYLTQMVNSAEIILHHLDNDLPYHDSLAYHFSWLPMGANFDAVTSGYELLLSTGVNIITNDSLRQEISYLYSNRYTWLRAFLKERQNMESIILRQDMLNKFKSFKITKEAVPRNYNELKSDDDFKVRVDHNAYSQEFTLGNYQNLFNEARMLNENIEGEIKRLSNK